jgi:hypothetical protein
VYNAFRSINHGLVIALICSVACLTICADCEDFERLARSTGVYQLHVRRLTGALRTYRTSQTPLPPATALRVQQEFLHFMLAPLEWRDPPRHYSDWLFDMTARLLRGVLPRGESDSEEEHDSHLYDDGIKIAQLGSCEWEASTGAPAPPPLQSGTAQARAAIRALPPHGGEVQATGTSVPSGEGVVPDDPGSDDEVDLRDCVQHVLHCPSSAGHGAGWPHLLFRAERFAEADARKSRA